MALKVNFELDDVIYDDCYLRIHKIRTVMVDYEYFETVNDPLHPEIAERLAWKIRLESSATAYVYANKAIRDNRAQPLKWFSFDFDYELENPRNIYQQAYDALKSTKEFKDAIDV